MHDLTRSAIQASLCGNWEEAIDLNTQILVGDKDNIAALNRLARAYTALDQKSSAKEIYERVLKLDKYNSVALRSLRALPAQNGHASLENTSRENFIEEPGLTRTTHLTKLAGKEVLLTLICKEQVTLSPRSRLISVTKLDTTYVGSLPDDLSLRLGKLMRTGYEYRACIKSASDNTVTLFLREVKRPGRPTASPSFSRHLKLKELKKKS